MAWTAKIKRNSRNSVWMNPSDYFVETPELNLASAGFTAILQNPEMPNDTPHSVIIQQLKNLISPTATAEEHTRGISSIQVTCPADHTWFCDVQYATIQSTTVWTTELSVESITFNQRTAKEQTLFTIPEIDGQGIDKIIGWREDGIDGVDIEFAITNLSKQCSFSADNITGTQLNALTKQITDATLKTNSEPFLGYEKGEVLLAAGSRIFHEPVSQKIQVNLGFKISKNTEITIPAGLTESGEQQQGTPATTHQKPGWWYQWTYYKVGDLTEIKPAVLGIAKVYDETDLNDIIDAVEEYAIT